MSGSLPLEEILLCDVYKYPYWSAEIFSVMEFYRHAVITFYNKIAHHFVKEFKAAVEYKRNLNMRSFSFVTIK